MTTKKQPEEIGWGKLGAEYICESTGAFLTKETCQVCAFFLLPCL